MFSKQFYIHKYLDVKENKSVAALRSGSDIFQHISVTGALLLNIMQCNRTKNLITP